MRQSQHAKPWKFSEAVQLFPFQNQVADRPWRSYTGMNLQYEDPIICTRLHYFYRNILAKGLCNWSTMGFYDYESDFEGNHFSANLVYVILGKYASLNVYQIVVWGYPLFVTNFPALLYLTSCLLTLTPTAPLNVSPGLAIPVCIMIGLIICLAGSREWPIPYRVRWPGTPRADDALQIVGPRQGPSHAITTIPRAPMLYAGTPGKCKTPGCSVVVVVMPDETYNLAIVKTNETIKKGTGGALLPPPAPPGNF